MKNYQINQIVLTYFVSIQIIGFFAKTNMGGGLAIFLYYP